MLARPKEAKPRTLQTFGSEIRETIERQAFSGRLRASYLRKKNFKN